MIQLSRINGDKILINPEQLLWVESKPDTLLTFKDGKTLLVRESQAHIAEMVLNYQRQIHSGSLATCSTQQPSLEL